MKREKILSIVQKGKIDILIDGFEYVTGEYADGGKIFRKRK